MGVVPGAEARPRGQESGSRAATGGEGNGYLRLAAGEDGDDDVDHINLETPCYSDQASLSDHMPTLSGGLCSHPSKLLRSPCILSIETI